MADTDINLDDLEYFRPDPRTSRQKAQHNWYKGIGNLDKTINNIRELQDILERPISDELLEAFSLLRKTIKESFSEIQQKFPLKK